MDSDPAHYSHGCAQLILIEQHSLACSKITGSKITSIGASSCRNSLDGFVIYDIPIALQRSIDDSVKTADTLVICGPMRQGFRCIERLVEQTY